MGAPLWRQHFAPDLLHMGVVSRGHTVLVTRYLSRQVGLHHNFFKIFLGRMLVYAGSLISSEEV